MDTTTRLARVNRSIDSCLRRHRSALEGWRAVLGAEGKTLADADDLQRQLMQDDEDQFNREYRRLLVLRDHFS